MNEKLLEYQEKFNEQFPLMLFRTMEEEQIMDLIDDCIIRNKPFEPELDENSNY